MKNISLTVKIWLALSLVSLLLYLIVLLIMPHLIRNFFTATLMQPHVPPEKNIIKEPLPSFLGVRGFNIRNLIILEDGTTIPPNAPKAIPDALLQNIKQNASTQQTSRHLYEYVDGQERVRYVIRKNIAYGRPLYQVSFFKRSEEDKFIKTLLFNFMVFAGITLVISWFASLFIARYLTRPLVQMKQHVKRIANRNWHEPLTVKQGDEIGQLAGSIETMRRQLVRQDEAQQSMLQNISHELKTPVMVIRSYAQAIQDGVYPKGDLAGSIQVIDAEGARLEKLIKQLLYLTRLDYLDTREQVQKEIELDRLVKKTVQLLYLQRSEITWQLDLQPVTIAGDEETLRVMIENLLENHLRHAASRLEVNLGLNSKKTEIILSFWNDGSRIEPHILNRLFQPFHKAGEGKFGLGLTIVQRIVKMYQGQITLKNERGGVTSTVIIPFR
ncbi:sensor histidine kinase [Desulfoscipio geothermicus]|uniref:histidine kinase n=1 Tax=Desulfoscipio geothermicus DSM 3669 TaxID=1121426 RepID=A0A1I6DV32_9FIRM|nr:HAMP domain-containing sensor histidine kinase [Desulfoscipio geothermicus]SFR09148.1 two-component system, OmpR family, sensor histidine kinase CssS [Desulfoscipio geothermicus DSM 3669]